MSRRSLFVGILLFPGLFAACGEGDDHEAMGMPTESVCPEDSTLTYENFGRDFFESYCTECHSTTLAGAERQGAPSDHNFDSLAEARLVHTDHIDEQAASGPGATNTLMPPGDAPAPSKAEREKLGQWLACGMP